ncbi:MAG: alpha/beta fold hydrolase, partial [Gammaproteobacteria bacterium]|nr:alpha/beta fold hydrolase [Gammaproteobacteria bacterium]
MLGHVLRILRGGIKATSYSLAGALVILVIVFVLYLENRPDLAVWHLADLDKEFTHSSETKSFKDYLLLEERLFAQLEEQVYTKIPANEKHLINRYHHGSLTDPTSQQTNWNRTFELPAEKPKAGVLLLHGMSDSPYSLRSLGNRFNAAGALVVGLRLPGHGTAPSGLIEIHWKDMAAAVRLAMVYLAERTENRPLYIVGYSNGAALAVQYALSTLEDDSLPEVKKLALVSPAIGVTSVAALAVWQARLGHLLGLEKLAWNSILPEYDPYKYGSFAVNAGDLVYRLTSEIQEQIVELGQTGKLKDLPPILAFSSVVDATVSVTALVQGLFEQLPEGNHELVLFDLNRFTEIEPILESDPFAAIKGLERDRDLPFTLKLITNSSDAGTQVVLRSKQPGTTEIVESDLELSWPQDIYSLSHVALPFRADDPIYGIKSKEGKPIVSIGNLALRGERGVLKIP